MSSLEKKHVSTLIPNGDPEFKNLEKMLGKPSIASSRYDTIDDRPYTPEAVDDEQQVEEQEVLFTSTNRRSE